MRQANDFDILGQAVIPGSENWPHAGQISAQKRRSLLEAIFGRRDGQAKARRPSDVSMAYAEQYRSNPDDYNSERNGY